MDTKNINASVYFYQEPWISAESGGRTPLGLGLMVSPPRAGLLLLGNKLTVPQYGIQLVVGSSLIVQSNFRGTGNLDATREMVKRYGEAVGLALVKRNVLACSVIPDQKYKGKCFEPSDSHVSFHLDSLINSISLAAPKIKIIKPAA